MRKGFSRLHSRVRLSSILAVLFSAFISFTCGQGYRELSTENGRRAVMEEAQNFLTAGLCNEAITVLKPLYESQYVDNSVRLLYASAYGCRGGLNMAGQIASLTDLGGSDIWSVLVKSNYSSGSQDFHIISLDGASDIIRQTNFIPGAFDAESRPKDANTLMVFVQINNIASIISPLGAADRATGKRTQALCAACSTSDVCHMQVAVAFIDDASDYMGSGTITTSLNSAISSACAGTCPTNKDLSVCMSNAALQTSGQAMITAIGSQWTLF